MDMHFHPKQPKAHYWPSMYVPENHADRTPNHLINDKSSYLLQHAYDPVQLYPRGDEALYRVKQENKSVF